MLQAISNLNDSYEVAALLDSDTVPPRDWLRELVAPLSDPRVGISSGNRWYMPDDLSWGGLVRYLWNAAAVVQMYWYGIAWGGSLAVRARLLREQGLLERLGRAFGEDSVICRYAIPRGWRVAFVPSLVMVNREGCSVPGFFRFLQRQLLTVRLANPWWWGVVAHGIATSAALAAALALLLFGLLSGRWGAVGWSAAGLGGYLASMILLLAIMEFYVRRILRARKEPADWLRLRSGFWALLAIPLTQAVYPIGLISTFFVRTHWWRGVQYRFGGGITVRVVKDGPYRGESVSPTDAAS
jgi:hypothetical protein